jgi:hypothetical protein
MNEKNLSGLRAGSFHPEILPDTKAAALKGPPLFIDSFIRFSDP